MQDAPDIVIASPLSGAFGAALVAERQYGTFPSYEKRIRDLENLIHDDEERQKRNPRDGTKEETALFRNCLEQEKMRDPLGGLVYDLMRPATKSRLVGAGALAAFTTKVGLVAVFSAPKAVRQLGENMGGEFVMRCQEALSKEMGMKQFEQAIGPHAKIIADKFLELVELPEGISKFTQFIKPALEACQNNEDIANLLFQKTTFSRRVNESGQGYSSRISGLGRSLRERIERLLNNGGRRLVS